MAPCNGAQRRTNDRFNGFHVADGCTPGGASAPARNPANQRTRREHAQDAGQVIPLMAGVLALVAVILVSLIALGNLVGDRARAQTAADAAALAGASGGRSSASSVSAENSGTLESFHAEGTEVEVTVRVGDARATARARRDW